MNKQFIWLTKQIQDLIGSLEEDQRFGGNDPILEDSPMKYTVTERLKHLCSAVEFVSWTTPTGDEIAGGVATIFEELGHHPSCRTNEEGKCNCEQLHQKEESRKGREAHRKASLREDARRRQ